MNINKITLAGNLTKDPEIRYTPKGTAVCKIGIAVNRRWKSETGEQKEEVLFADADAFGRTAENIAQYFKKGRKIYIEGRLKTDSWEDKQSGQKRSKLGIVVDTFQFVDSPPKDGQSAAPESRRAEPPAAEPTPNQPTDSDDVPF